jgi:hypothetical protein
VACARAQNAVATMEAASRIFLDTLVPVGFFVQLSLNKSVVEERSAAMHCNPYTEPQRSH